MRQRMVPRRRANEVRSARAAVKRRIAAGEVGVAEILDPRRALSDYMLAMPVCELLMAQERWGPTRVRRLLARLAIGERRPLGNLTARQRRHLIEALERTDDRRDARLLSG